MPLARQSGVDRKYTPTEERATKKRVLLCVTLQPQFEMPPYVAPLVRQNAVHHRIARRPVAPWMVMPNHAVFFCAECFDGTL